MTNNMGRTRLSEMTAEVERAREILHGYFPPGSSATTVVSHVTRSGMSRSIRVLVGNADGEVSDLSWAVARVLGWRFDGEHGGVKVQGTGMDMGFHLVYTLSVVLHRGADSIKHRSL